MKNLILIFCLLFSSMSFAAEPNYTAAQTQVSQDTYTQKEVFQQRVLENRERNRKDKIWKYKEESRRLSRSSTNKLFTSLGLFLSSFLINGGFGLISFIAFSIQDLAICGLFFSVIGISLVFFALVGSAVFLLWGLNESSQAEEMEFRAERLEYMPY